MENTHLSLLDRFNNWLKESVMIKLLSIGFLILILLIPASWIESLINERQYRADDVVREISNKWSGTQTLTGPVLVIPFTKVETIKSWQKGIQIEEVSESVHQAFFLPEELLINGKVAPKVLERGIFEAVVYDSKIQMKAKFGNLDFTRWNVQNEQIHWKEAKLVTGISDLRGISENPVISSGQKKFESEPSSDIGLTNTVNGNPEMIKGIAASMNWNSNADVVSDFSIDLQLKGSEQLYFVPAGKTTEVKVSGDWTSPSFDGQMLPNGREITEKGFNAVWKILSYNRPFSQQWVDNEQHLNGAEFGVRLLIPADQYQKSIRTAKYGVLIIILAFTVLFLVELTAKVRIHPFQYILVGAALIIYYTLLLSFSEHWGYDTAYAIASIATVTLVALYSTTFLIKKSLTVLFTLLMTLFYTFIFVIIQAEDYSLLIGSVGLFIIIAVIMYFSRNIKWYKETET
ncbi:MAG: cell envelope integrity protein CreD, partial [Azospira oryzae]